MSTPIAKTDLQYATKILIAYTMGLRIQYYNHFHKVWLDYTDDGYKVSADMTEINDPSLVRIHPDDAARMCGVLIGLTQAEINQIARAVNIGEFNLCVPNEHMNKLVGSPNLCKEVDAIIKSIVDIIHPLNTL